MVEVRASDGAMPAYLVTPEGEGSFPGVVVVMEAFGLNQHIKSVAERSGLAFEKEDWKHVPSHS